MPTDNKRNTGPESSKPYSLYRCNNKDKVDSSEKEVVVNNRRKDGRKCDELRRIYMKHGVVSQAKGSAYVELGNTKVICSVFDPREIPRKSDYSVNGELYCEFKFAPFACKTRRGYQMDWEENESSLILRRSLESAVCRHEFPNFQVDVYVLVLEDDGSALAAGITCAGIALADASVPMYDLVAAVTAGVNGDNTLLDLTSEEEAYCSSSLSTESKNNGIMTAAYMSTQEQISEYVQTGFMDADCVTATVTLLIDACNSIYPISQQCIIKSVKESVKNRKKESTENNS